MRITYHRINVIKQWVLLLIAYTIASYINVVCIVYVTILKIVALKSPSQGLESRRDRRSWRRLKRYYQRQISAILEDRDYFEATEFLFRDARCFANSKTHPPFVIISLLAGVGCNDRRNCAITSKYSKGGFKSAPNTRRKETTRDDKDARNIKSRPIKSDDSI